MSIATALAVPAVPSPHGDDFVTLAEVARILGRQTNPSIVKSLALAGSIRTRCIPGDRIRYSRVDAERLADTQGQGR